MHPLEFLMELVGDLLCGFVGPEKDPDRYWTVFWLVATVLLAVGICAILVHLA